MILWWMVTQDEGTALSNVVWRAQEVTLNLPNVVNAKKNTELLYSGPMFLGSHK